MRSPIEPCVAWVERGQAQLGYGISEELTADSLDSALELAAGLAAGAHGSGPWFGGLAFPGTRVWPGFPGARFVRPQRLEHRAWAAPRPKAVAGVIAPMSETWRAAVSRAGGAIAKGELEKVVLARSHDVGAPKDAWRTFEGFAPAARHFFFRFDGGCFMGATPETLVRWRDGRLEIDALAGSAPPAGEFGDKERREHAVVVRDVVRALEGLAVELPPEPRALELSYVRHLYTPVRAAAGPGFDFGRVLARLFPTSAVAGAPRDRALRFIAEHEGLDRGWYAGAVGRIAPGDVDLAVALRCVHVTREHARLFAGAGIVAGSDAQAEWDETARKMTPALGAIAVSAPSPLVGERAGVRGPLSAAQKSPRGAS